MKKLLLTTALIALCLTSLFSQPCLPEGITFTTQAQIDSFQINYPGCTEIEGDVLIMGNDITNLYGLYVLTSIYGTLEIIENDLLPDLWGLENLTSVGGSLSIGDSWILYGTVVNQGNPLLTNLTGLNNLISIGEDFHIEGNESLIDLSGFDNVNSLGGNLRIGNNESLLSISGLNNITSTGGTIWIYYNENLTNISGLENINYVGGSLIIGMISRYYPWFLGNPSLSNLTGLENITSVGEYLLILGNASLTSLTGLENIDPSSIIDLQIRNNSSLSECEVQSICDYLVNPNGLIDIQDNAPGCNSQQEVEDACETVRVADIIDHSIFSIYPNPATNEVFISTNNDITIKEINIYNQVGQIIIHKSFLPNKIDVSLLQEGMYVIELVTNDIKVEEKLIIR